MRRAQKPDAQAFDEVRIVTVPRFKDSQLSGSEWRISATVEILRKGRVITSAGFCDVETAVHLLSSVWHRAIDEGCAYYAGEDDFCDQEGCNDQATVFYKVKHEYCNLGKVHNAEIGDSWRAFCDKHAKRGDQSFNDSDANYERLFGRPSESEPHKLASNVMEAKFEKQRETGASTDGSKCSAIDDSQG